MHRCLDELGEPARTNFSDEASGNVQPICQDDARDIILAVLHRFGINHLTVDDVRWTWRSGM